MGWSSGSKLSSSGRTKREREGTNRHESDHAPPEGPWDVGEGRRDGVVERVEVELVRAHEALQRVVPSAALREKDEAAEDDDAEREQEHHHDEHVCGLVHRLDHHLQMKRNPFENQEGFIFNKGLGIHWVSIAVTALPLQNAVGTHQRMCQLQALT